MNTLIADQKLVTELLPMDEAIEVMRERAGLLDAGRRRHAAAQHARAARRRRRPGADAVVPGRPRGRSASRSSPPSRPTSAPSTTLTRAWCCLRHRARPAAGHRRRHVDHGHPHGRSERRGHRPAGAAGRRRPRASSAPARRRTPTCRRCARAACATRARVQRAGGQRRGIRASASQRLTGLPWRSRRQAEEAVDGRRPDLHVTTATEPVVLGAWLNPGAHINAVGRLHAHHARAGLRRRGPRALVRRPARGAAQRGRRVPAGRRPRAPSATITSSARSARCCRQGAGTRLARRDHAVQVAGHRHRRPGGGRTSVYTAAASAALGTWVDIGGRHFGSAAAN